VATLTTLSTVTRHADASISGVGTVVALGTILGEEWTDVPVEENTWTELSASSDVWTDSTVGTNDWKRRG
tara:strand:- start:229 stop:438 length:210 start_codon:yes stop_codon:yes gene_type:complete